MYLSKFDRYGTPIWTLAWNADEGYMSYPEVECDSSGNIYIAGFVQGGYLDPIDLDPGPGKHVFFDDRCAFYLMKLNPAGMFDWSHEWGPVFGTLPLIELAVSDSGRIWVTGRWDEAKDYDPGSGNVIRISSGHSGSDLPDNSRKTEMSPPWPNTEDFYLMEFNTEGDLLMVRTWGTNKPGSIDGLAIDRSGNSVISGYFQNIVDFGPGQGNSVFVSNGHRDAYVSKFDITGNRIWSFTFGGEFYEYVSDVVLDNSGNVYVTGTFSMEVDFDPGPGEAIHVSSNPEPGYYDMYLCKYDSDGSYVWSRTWEARDYRLLTDELAVSEDSVWLQGTFYGNIDFDPGAGEDFRSIDKVQNFVTRLDHDGNYLGARTWSMDHNDECKGLVPGIDGGIWVTGWYSWGHPSDSYYDNYINVRSYLSWFSNETEAWN